MKSRQNRKPGIVTSLILLPSIFLMWSSSAIALDPALDVSQYAHTSWKIQDGFPAGTVNVIVQTPDGYLWLGTEFGLVRFDGVRGIPLTLPRDHHLPSNAIETLLVDHNGTLWIGTAKGLASWRDGKLIQYPEFDGQNVVALLEDHEGTVWVGVWGPGSGRLCGIQGGRVHCEGENGTLGYGVGGMHEDGKANLWAGSHNGLWRIKPGLPKFYPAADGTDIHALLSDNNGDLLVGVRGSVTRIVDGKMETAYSLPPSQQPLSVSGLLRDRNGGIWIGTGGGGIVHPHQGRTDVFTVLDGLSGNRVIAFFEDREGNIWVSTSNGLDRFREFAVATFSPKQGFATVGGGSLLSARDGSLWFSTNQGLGRFKNGQMTIYGKRTSTADTSRIHVVSDSGLPAQTVIPLFEAEMGRIWASTRAEVGYIEHDRFTPQISIPGAFANSMVEVIGGDPWLARHDLGLLRLLPTGEVQQIPSYKLGHVGSPRTLIADPQRGLWIGFDDGGIMHFSDGQVAASYTAAEGLGKGRVSQLHFDSDGALWASTEGGLSRLKNGRVVTLTSKNGLPCDEVQWTTEDDADSFWLNMPCGLVRVGRPQLHAWFTAVEKGDSTSPLIQTTVLDNSDGIRSSAGVVNFNPPVAKSSDGKLWFLSWDGLSVIDPNHLPFNPVPPTVHIEQIIADRKIYDASFAAKGLPPLIRDLQIDYTALSFVAPEKMRFRYKLEGHDRDWQDAGNRRQAFYNNLPPRNYRFRVIASNNSGVWNEVGASLDFSVAPAYYQTTWFRLLVVAAFLSLLAGLYQLRLRQVARQFNMRMEERVNERTRIARELHDTLLQNFQAALLRFHTVTYLLPSRPDEARSTVESVVEQARQALTDGRDAVEGLRSSTVVDIDLARAISSLGEKLAADQSGVKCPDFRVLVEGTPKNLVPLLQEEVYRISSEALRNSFRHAHAKRIEVELRYDHRQLCLRVRDNGNGIDPKVRDAGGRVGHYGLTGMYERAKLVGGKLTVWSELDSGTEIELTIPASIAYARPPAQHRSMSSGKGT